MKNTPTARPPTAWPPRGAALSAGTAAVAARGRLEHRSMSRLVGLAANAWVAWIARYRTVVRRRQRRPFAPARSVSPLRRHEHPERDDIAEYRQIAGRERPHRQLPVDDAVDP